MDKKLVCREAELFLTWKPKVRSYVTGCNWNTSANDYSFHFTANVLLELLIFCAAWRKKNLHPLLISSSSDTIKMHYQSFAYFGKEKQKQAWKSPQEPKPLCIIALLIN